jgi:hypothetical protein
MFKDWKLIEVLKIANWEMEERLFHSFWKLECSDQGIETKTNIIKSL